MFSTNERSLLYFFLYTVTIFLRASPTPRQINEARRGYRLYNIFFLYQLIILPINQVTGVYCLFQCHYFLIASTLVYLLTLSVYLLIQSSTWSAYF